MLIEQGIFWLANIVYVPVIDGRKVMNSRARFLLLFDNNGNEYVSRIKEGASRFGAAGRLSPMERESVIECMAA